MFQNLFQLIVVVVGEVVGGVVRGDDHVDARFPGRGRGLVLGLRARQRHAPRLPLLLHREERAPLVLALRDGRGGVHGDSPVQTCKRRVTILYKTLCKQVSFQEDVYIDVYNKAIMS